MRMVSMEQAGMLAIGFVVFVVSVVVGGTVLAGIQATQTSGTTAYNASTSGLSGIKNLADQAPVIGTILGAVVIIGLLYAAFMRS